MFNEKCNLIMQDKDIAGMSLKDVDAIDRHFRGVVQDTLIDANNLEVIETREWDSNIVVNNCSKLIACLIKNQSGMQGATYWAVGKGSNSWSNDNPPLPKETDEKLLDEVYRKTIPTSNIKFVDSLGAETGTPTNTIEITITFDETEANGELREFGIVGGSATGTKDSGIFINHKIHPLIYKTNQMILKRVLRLTF